MIGERAHVEVVHGQVLGRDAELRRRLAHLARQRVGREALGQRARRDRERDVAHVGAVLDEPGHRAAAAELAVIRVRREHERALDAARSRRRRLRQARRARGDRDQREQPPERRVFEERVVEDAVHEDRDQG